MEFSRRNILFILAFVEIFFLVESKRCADHEKNSYRMTSTNHSAILFLFHDCRDSHMAASKNSGSAAMKYEAALGKL